MVGPWYAISSFLFEITQAPINPIRKTAISTDATIPINKNKNFILVDYIRVSWNQVIQEINLCYGYSNTLELLLANLLRSTFLAQNPLD